MEQIGRIVALLLLFLTAFPPSSLGTTTTHPDRYEETLALFRLHYDKEALKSIETSFTAVHDPVWKRRLDYLEGTVHVRLGQPRQAKTALARVIQGKDPLSQLARAQWVLACYQLGEHHDGLQTLAKLQSRQEDPVWMATQRALLLTGKGDLAQAIKAWKAVLSLGRRDVPKALARFHLSRIYQKQGRLNEASNQRKKLVVHHPGTPLGLETWSKFSATLTVKEKHTRASKLWDARRYEQAIQAYTDLLSSPRWKDEAHLKIGRLYSERLRTNYDKAEHHFAQASRARDQKIAGEAHYKLGLVYGKQRRYEKAISTLRAFRKRYPTDSYRTEAGFEIGRHLAEAGQFNEAGNHISKWLKREGNLSKGVYTRYLWFAGWAYYRGQLWNKALQTFSELSGSRKTLVGDKSLYWTARVQEKQGKRDKAIVTLHRLLTRFPHSYYAWLAIRRLEKWGQRSPRMLVDFSPVPNTFPPPWAAQIASRKGKTILSQLRDLVEVGAIPRARQFWKRHQMALRPMMKGPDFNRLTTQMDRALENVYTLRKQAFKKHGRLRTQYPSHKNLHGWRELFPRAFNTMTGIAARKEGLPEWLLYSHMLQESRYGTHMVSGANAYGLIQILPSTGQLIAEDINLDFEAEWLFDAGYNIRLAAWYLGALSKRFQGQLPLAIASYNGGPRLLSFHIKQYPGLDMEELIESLPAHQSRNYVRKVMEHLFRYLAIYTPPQTLRNVMENLISDEVNTVEGTEPAY